MMWDRNTEVPTETNDDEASPAEETKDDITQEVEMQERQANYKRETLELMARQKNVNKEARRLQRQQAAMVMDHLCDNLLDVGGYNAAEHPFTVWLKAKNIKSVLTLFTISHETMIADSYDPPTHLWERLVAIKKYYHSAKPDENRYLQFMGFFSNELAKYMDSKAPTGILRPPTYPTQNPNEQFINVPVAGTASQAAMLRNARRSSTVTFGTNTNITERSGARQSRSSSLGS